MIRTQRFRLTCVALLLGIAASASGADIEAITAPSKARTLEFNRPGRIAKVLVKDGETVAAGQVLVQLDDTVEQAQLQQLKALADDETRIQAAQAQLDQKTVDLKKIQRAFDSKAVTELELDHAKLDVTIAELSLKLARFEQDQAKLKHKEMGLHVERMRLKSPIAGKVGEVLKNVGESVDSRMPVVQVVQIDPLWVDVHVPQERTTGLKQGQSALVRFRGKAATEARGRIIYVASQVDAASDTLKVRVEVANPTGRPAGQRVDVRFAGADADKKTP
jgi:RND family efflux transporter MFP subunit